MVLLNGRSQNFIHKENWVGRRVWALLEWKDTWIEILAVVHQLVVAKEKYIREKQNQEWAQEIKMNLECGSKGMRSELKLPRGCKRLSWAIKCQCVWEAESLELLPERDWGLMDWITDFPCLGIFVPSEGVGGGGKNHLFLLIWKRDFWAKAVKRFVAWLCQHGLSKSQGMNQKLMEEVMGWDRSGVEAGVHYRRDTDL